jgi:Pup-ligase protein
MRAHGLEWDAFDSFLALRDELLELDLRFGQLDESGIFAALDRAGVLAHAVPRVDADSVLDAIYNPPRAGRAHLRGTLVRRLSAQPGSYRCSWDTIWDHGANRYLDLSNPFATTADWQPGQP